METNSPTKRFFKNDQKGRISGPLYVYHLPARNSGPRHWRGRAGPVSAPWFPHHGRAMLKLRLGRGSSRPFKFSLSRPAGQAAAASRCHDGSAAAVTVHARFKRPNLPVTRSSSPSRTSLAGKFEHEGPARSCRRHGPRVTVRRRY